MLASVFIIGGLSILLVNHFNANNLMNIIYDSICNPNENSIQKTINNTQPISITIYHTIIYVFSICQMLYLRGKECIMLICDVYVKTQQPIKIECFSKFPSIYRLKLINNISSLEFDNFKTKCDILTITDNTTKPANCICYYSNDYEIISKYKDNDLSNISFISLILTHNKIEYKIILKNNEFNYYIVNNVINSTFLHFYLKFILKSTINLDTDYVLTLIDNNVKVLILDNNDSIVINKDDYNILNEKKE